MFSLLLCNIDQKLFQDNFFSGLSIYGVNYGALFIKIKSVYSTRPFED